MTPAVMFAQKDAYALWAATYPPTAHNPLMVAEERVVTGLLAALGPTRALDVGTGTGRYLRPLARTGASTVIGLDLSPEMLARGSWDSVRVCGDARRLPFAPETFDLINASLMAGDIDDIGAWLCELASTLTPGGHLIYSDFHTSWATNGWRRTFNTADGRTIELHYVPHTIEDHLRAVRHAGLDLVECRDVFLADDSGHDVLAFRNRWGNPAVAIVIHAVKSREV